MKVLRALIITEAVRQKINDLVIYAADPRNWYDFRDRSEGWMDRLPGHNEQLSCRIAQGYRCVFSYTHDKERHQVFRHLSVSVDGGGYPAPEAVIEIARLFGFTGQPVDRGPVLPMFPEDWLVDVRKAGQNQFDDPCVIVAQDTGIQA